MQWEPWQIMLTIAASIVSTLAHLSIALALFVLWVDKRDGLPYAFVLPLMAVWILCCGLAQGTHVMANVYVRELLWYMPLLYTLRAAVGLPAAIAVWWGVWAATKYAPPKQMQSTIAVLKHVIEDSIRVEEKLRDGPAGPSTTSDRHTAMGDSSLHGSQSGRGDSVRRVVPKAHGMAAATSG